MSFEAELGAQLATEIRGLVGPIRSEIKTLADIFGREIKSMQERFDKLESRPAPVQGPAGPPGTPGPKGDPGINGADGKDMDIECPEEIAEQVSKAIASLCESPPILHKNNMPPIPQIVLNLMTPERTPVSKQITTRRDENGNMIATVTEREQA